MNMQKERINYYEDLFKQFVMSCVVNESDKTLRQYMLELIEENNHEYKYINYAFIAVKKELVG